MSAQNTSITDQPITSIDEEALDIQDYATALVDFIKDSATPLTVGIQGEWGSGKTSLMYLIQTQLRDNNVATAWVNTWEYSMFRQAAETTPEILRGLLENLKASCIKLSADFWPKDLSGQVERVGNILRGLGKLAVDMAVNKAVGVEGITDKVSAGGKSEGGAKAEIAEIKMEIASIIATLIAYPANPFNKVVFFIDDLDRIEPALAVEILESLKNIFDVPNAVFILAIDYDVVVKGLEKKFGVKTQENEREFRSFFDKIIQVPFSMPLSAYNIDKLIQARFNELGFTIDSAFEEAYREIASYTVGSNPRSIKRYINTYSLLNRIRNISQDEGASDNSAKYDFALFALIGIQIAYPQIYNFIIKEPDFVSSWNHQFAAHNDVEINIPEEYTKNELLDEPWEQFVWSACQKDGYLKANVTNILSALNCIRRVIKDDSLAMVVHNAMQIANITSVEESRESSSSKFQRVRFEGWDAYFKNQRAKGCGTEALNLLQGLHDYLQEEYGEKSLRITYTGSGDVTFKAMNAPKRRKVFVYAGIYKNWARFGCHVPPKKWEDIEIKKPGDLTDEVKEKIRNSYNLIMEGAI